MAQALETTQNATSATPAEISIVPEASKISGDEIDSADDSDHRREKYGRAAFSRKQKKSVPKIWEPRILCTL